MCLIEELNLYKQPENEKVAKTIVNNNTVYLYNSSGELISSETIGEINFKPIFRHFEELFSRDKPTHLHQKFLNL